MWMHDQSQVGIAMNTKELLEGLVDFVDILYIC